MIAAMQTDNAILRIAVPSPLRRMFDYLPPADKGSGQQLFFPGQRLRVPFGRCELIGVLVEVQTCSDIPTDKLKPVIEVLDQTPLLPEHLFRLCRWAADYYQHPIGDAMLSLLPTLLRKGEAAEFRSEYLWVASPQAVSGAEAVPRRAARQQALHRELQNHPQGVSADALKALGYSAALLRALAEKGVAVKTVQKVTPPSLVAGENVLHESPLVLNAEQSVAVQSLNTHLGSFQCSLLEGITGSGKTEVYLQLIQQVLERGEQALVLVPEIGLTPQTVARFRKRFRVPIVALHSGLNDRERLDGWLMARCGAAGIVIGTRSAVFTPLKFPGLIIIDEEHDASFKQQEGFRYSARDLAILRAREEKLPIVLGSATPSLETLHNARCGRYQWLRLTERAGEAQLPHFELLDICREELENGLSATLIEQIRQHLQRDEQVLVFLNRRGFSPSLMCHDCGWLADCPQCDAHMTLHRFPPQLHCHHCDHQTPVVLRCPKCNGRHLNPLGAGTERTDEALQRLFPETPVIRVDRDTTRRKEAMEQIMRRIHSTPSCILVGTQMLAKGHHFPRVTLVAILDADAGLFSADFRGMEKMAQLILQVAGRAGREDRPGRVLMQTYHADHPRIRSLIQQGYLAFAEQELQDRETALLPPFSHYALLRAEAVAPGRADAFLQLVRQLAERRLGGQAGAGEIKLLGPLPAPMERRAGRYRAQLLFQSSGRKSLHHLLQGLGQMLESDKQISAQARKVRWSIDVDPLDMF
jgi:primosomal protein N' (replication factor Y)